MLREVTPMGSSELWLDKLQVFILLFERDQDLISPYIIITL